jgi:peroxin-6
MGADFYALCSDAMLKAVTRQASAVDAKIKAINAERAAGISTHPRDATAVAAQDAIAAGDLLPPISTAAFFDHYSTPDDVNVLVTEDDFFAAERELVPSVSATELAHYERVRASFEGARQSKDQAAAAAAAAATAASAQDERGGDGGGKGKGKGKVAEMAQVLVARDKGKGKARDVPASGPPGGFEEGKASDDDGLY